MTPELRAACAKSSQVFCADGRVLSAGRGALYILGAIGWPRTARFLSWPPMIWCVELGYWIVANNRTLFSRVLFRP